MRLKRALYDAVYPKRLFSALATMKGAPEWSDDLSANRW